MQIFLEARKAQVEIGLNRLYAAMMQLRAAKGPFGANRGTDKNGRALSASSASGNIPARPFLGISEANSANIVGQIKG